MSKKIDYRSSRIADQIRKGVNGSEWLDLAEYMVTKFNDRDWFEIKPEDAWVYTADGTYGVLVASEQSWSHFRPYILGRV